MSKQNKNKEMAPPPNHRTVSPPLNNTSSRREAGMKKEDQVALISAAADVVDAASHNKRREEMKKEEDEVALIIPVAAAAAAAHNKRRRTVKKKKPPITVNEKIPQGTLATLRTMGTKDGSVKFNMHKSLANKKVVLYGLPGYHNPVAHFNVDVIAEQSKKWRPFYEKRVMEPALEFIKHADYLKENGVDEIVFFSVNGNVLMFAFKNEELRKRYKYVRFITDYNDRYMHSLGMEMDILHEGMPPRSRRFILLVDNLKVKVVNIESSNENFTIPSDEEISKAFYQ